MRRDLPPQEQESWRESGRRAATALSAYTGVVVASHDPRIAAHAALGVAEASALFRNTIIVDLAGTAAIDSIPGSADVLGVSDAFEFGVSLERLAQPHGLWREVSVIGSGTDAPLGEEVFRSRRWKAFAERLLDGGTLLLLVTDAAAAGVGDLVAQLDGVVLVDQTGIEGAPNARVLARVGGPAMSPRPAQQGHSAKYWMIAATAMIVTLAAIAAGYGFYTGRLVFPKPEPPPARAVTPAPAPAPVVPQGPLPANPADSATAAIYSVEILSANSEAGANFSLRRNASFVPAATVAPIPVGPEKTIWYKVIGGAFRERAAADSLLALLRKSKIVPDSSGAVIQTPLALLLDSIPAQAGMVERIQTMVDSLARQGFPAYALMQGDGGAILYAGAFSRPEESEPMAAAMKEVGITPLLAYRIGRTR